MNARRKRANRRKRKDRIRADIQDVCDEMLSDICAGFLDLLNLPLERSFPFLIKTNGALKNGKTRSFSASVRPGFWIDNILTPLDIKGKITL